MNNHRGKSCAHFDQFIQGNPVCENAADMFYLIKDRGRSKNRGLAFIKLQVVPRNRPFAIDEQRTTRCPIMGDFAYKCKRSQCCDIKMKTVFVKEYVDLQVCHTQCGLAVLEDADPIAFIGSEETRKALRYWHMINHPSEYTTTSYKEWVARDTYMSSGNLLEKRALQEFGFDTAAATRGLKGKTPTAFSDLGKKQRRRRASTGGVQKIAPVTPSSRARAQTTSPVLTHGIESSKMPQCLVTSHRTMDRRYIGVSEDHGRMELSLGNEEIGVLQSFNDIFENQIAGADDFCLEDLPQLASQHLVYQSAGVQQMVPHSMAQGMQANHKQMATGTHVVSAQITNGKTKISDMPAHQECSTTGLEISMSAVTQQSPALPSTILPTTASAEQKPFVEEFLEATGDFWSDLIGLHLAADQSTEMYCSDGAFDPFSLNVSEPDFGLPAGAFDASTYIDLD